MYEIRVLIKNEDPTLTIKLQSLTSDDVQEVEKVAGAVLLNTFEEVITEFQRLANEEAK